MVITLDNAVNTVPRRMERNVKAGSPSSLVDTRNLETSNPVEGQLEMSGKLRSTSLRTILDDRMSFYICHGVVRACLGAGNDWSLNWRLVDLGLLVFRSI